MNSYWQRNRCLFYILVFILSDFFLNVLILKLYKRNTDVQMDTQITIRTQVYGCSHAGKSDGVQYKSYNCKQYI